MVIGHTWLYRMSGARDPGKTISKHPAVSE